MKHIHGLRTVYVYTAFITAVPITKLFAWWEGVLEIVEDEGDSGGHVLRETTSRGLYFVVCPSRTSECTDDREDS
jgi:hypothetical protein